MLRAGGLTVKGISILSGFLAFGQVAPNNL